MNVNDLEERNLTTFLPKNLSDSLLSFIFVNHRVDGGPNLVTCHTNGYLYEIQNKKITQSLSISDNATSVSYYYLLEKEKIVLFYLVFTCSYNLLIIRKTSKFLQITKEYKGVKEFQVYDYECLGFPQIKTSYLNDSTSIVCKFPVEPCIETECSKNSKPIADSLTEKLQILHKHIDDLTNEVNHLRNICFYNNSLTDSTKISLGSVKFSSSLSRTVPQKWNICDKWHKLFGANLILGLKLRNISNEVIHNFADQYQFIIHHKKLKEYSYNFFYVSDDMSRDLFLPRNVHRAICPREIVHAVGAFKIPAFIIESQFSISCYMYSSNMRDCFVKEIFQVNLWDVATKNIAEFELQFTVEDLLAIKTLKFEICVKIQTNDLEDDFMERVLTKYLGFKKIKPMKDKLFYCTSNYLNGIFVALQHIAANPSVWKMLLYTSEQCQIYFFINAIYDHLPENSSILCEES